LKERKRVGWGLQLNDEVRAAGQEALLLARGQRCQDVSVARKVKFVCVPLNKNGEGINDPASHLNATQLFRFLD
jgi:hypothetical protein